MDSNLYEVCKYAAAKLGFPLPAEGTAQGLYDGKWLLPSQPPPKPALTSSACLSEGDESLLA